MRGGSTSRGSCASRRVRPAIASRTSVNERPLRALHTVLVAPLERARMLGGVHALVVVPHGALAYLPFAALVRDGAAGRYLVEDYSVVTLASASALPAL